MSRNYGAYGTIGGSGGGGGSGNITIDFTTVIGGTPYAVLYVNADGTLGDDENGNFSYHETTSYLQVGESYDGITSHKGFVWLRGLVDSGAQPSNIQNVVIGGADNDTISTFLITSAASDSKFPIYGALKTTGLVGSEGTTATDSTLGRYGWSQYWATSDAVTSLGYIEGYNDGAISNTQRRQGIAFCTGSNPLQTPFDRIIIDSNGEVGIGYNRATSLYGLFGMLAPSPSPADVIFYIRDDADAVYITRVLGDNTLIHTGAVAFDKSQYYTSGSTVTMDDNIRILYINPPSTVASLDITMNPNPYDGQEVIIAFGGDMTSGIAISALTINGNTSQTILLATPITIGLVGESYMIKWNATSSTWHII